MTVIKEVIGSICTFGYEQNPITESADRIYVLKIVNINAVSITFISFLAS